MILEIIAAFNQLSGNYRLQPAILIDFFFSILIAFCFIQPAQGDITGIET